MRRSFTRVLVLAAFGLLVGCTSPNPQPTGSTTTPGPSPTETNAVFYYVADTPLGFKLFQENHVMTTLQPVAIEALNRLVDGTESPLDSDYTNLWGNSSYVNGITISDEIATIDFGKIKLNVGSEAEAAAINQIVWTVTANDPTVTKIRFTLNGDTIESFAGHVDTTGTFTRGEGFEALSAVNILEPADGDTLSGEISVSGLACTFEANVAWDLYKDGKKFDSGSTLASEACPVTSPWQVDLGLLDAGTYEFKAMEYSMKDGSLSAIDTKYFFVE